MMTTVLSLVLMAVIGRAAGSETLVTEGDYACLITTAGGMQCWGLNSTENVGVEETVDPGADEASTDTAMGYFDLGKGGTVMPITIVDSPPRAVLDDEKVCETVSASCCGVQQKGGPCSASRYRSWVFRLEFFEVIQTRVFRYVLHYFQEPLRSYKS